MVNFGPLADEIGPVVWGTSANFNGFRVLAALLHGSQAVSVRVRHLHVCSAWRPSRWALAHILVIDVLFQYLFFNNDDLWTENVSEESRGAPTSSFPLPTEDGRDTIWTPAIVFRVSTISVLMMLTLLGNVSLVVISLRQSESSQYAGGTF